MYRFVDQPVASLGTGARLLLWGMREWVSAIHDRRCPEARLLPVFARWNINDMLLPFTEMMRTLNLRARNDIGFAPPHCCVVSEDEAVLLALAADVDRRSPDEMTATLSLIVRTGYVAPMHVAVRQVVAAMGAAGLAPEEPKRSASTSSRK